nr:MAG TPA: hypothetical protein [Caudoviricetes sp.]
MYEEFTKAWTFFHNFFAHKITVCNCCVFKISRVR